MYKIYLITRTVVDNPEARVFRWFAETEKEACDFVTKYQRDDNKEVKIEYHIDTIYSYKT